MAKKRIGKNLSLYFDKAVIRHSWLLMAQHLMALKRVLTFAGLIAL